MKDSPNMVTCDSAALREKTPGDPEILDETHGSERWHHDEGYEASSPVVKETIREEKLGGGAEMNSPPQRMATVLESYQKKQAVLSPIQRVPSEILLEIFKYLDLIPSDDGDIWDSIKPPKPNTLLSGVPRLSSFHPSGSHSELPVARVCVRWRLLSRTNLFVSTICVNNDIDPRRMASWLQNTGATLLDCNIQIQPCSKSSLDSVNRLLATVLVHLPRIAVLSFQGTMDMMQTILLPTMGHAASNLVSLALAAPRSPSDELFSTREKVEIASVELPKLHFLSISSYFHPRYLQIFAPRLRAMQLQLFTVQNTHLVELARCLPALEVLYVNSDIFERGGLVDFSMPFPQLTALHILLRFGDREQSIPLLEGCRRLQIISIAHIRDTFYGTLLLPPSSATHFICMKNVGDDEEWLKQELFESLPNVRHLFLGDHLGGNNIRWSDGAHYDLSYVQDENDRIINHVVDGSAFPLLESATFKNFAVRSEVLSALIEKRQYLRLTWSREDLIVETKVPRQDDPLGQLKRFDDPEEFFKPWIDYGSISQQ